MEQQFVQACMEQAIMSTTADGSPHVSSNKSSIAQRLENWKLWDVSHAVRQMDCVGSTARPFNLQASTKEREQMLAFDPIKCCESTCDNMLEELEPWQEQLGLGYSVIKNTISEFMKPKMDRSVVEALANELQHTDRTFGSRNHTEYEQKLRKKKLDAFEMNFRSPVETALRDSHDDGILTARLNEARRLFLCKSRKYLLTSCHLLSPLFSLFSSLLFDIF
jgi:hypothetical protein